MKRRKRANRNMLGTTTNEEFSVALVVLLVAVAAAEVAAAEVAAAEVEDGGVPMKTGPPILR